MKRAVFGLMFAVGLFFFLSAADAAPVNTTPPDPHRLVTNIFHTHYQQLHAGVARDHLTAIYDIQTLTQALMLMAKEQGSVALLDSLAAILLNATTTLQTVSFYPLNSWNRRDSIPLGKSYSMWLFPRPLTVDGERITVREEMILSSSQFLFQAAQLLYHTLNINPDHQHPNLQQLLSLFPSLLLEQHYQRWVIDSKPFRLSGWGCARGTYNHQEFLRLKRTRRFWFKKPHCPVVTDTDLFIIAGVSLMVAAHTDHPDKVEISPENLLKYKAYLQEAEALLAARIDLRTIALPGREVEGFAFDNGMYRRYADHRYALYTEPDFPGDHVRPPVPRDASWDISHARRFVYVFKAMEMVADKAQLTLDYNRYLHALAHQFYYVVYIDTTRHLFANYLNGDNGWYRVNYHGAGSGFPPYSLSLTALEGGWFFLGERYPPIAELGIRIWNTFNSNPEHFNQYYGVLFRNHQPLYRTFETHPGGNIRFSLLQWLPSLQGDAIP